MGGENMTRLAYQPPTQIDSKDGIVTVLQLTDLHLYDHSSTPLAQRGLAPQYQDSFEALLSQALRLSDQVNRCDLILVTGDLVNEVDPLTYDQIFARLQRTGIPFACIAGNHDVTDELGMDLPFDQRQLVARASDERLVDHHRIDTPYWQLLLINSSVPGMVAGHIRAETIEWLTQQLRSSSKPALLALHHHVLASGAAWIDDHMATGTQALWQMLKQFDHLKIIINGHVHQDQTRHHQGVTLYSTPSTSYQFKPFSDEFAFDEAARPGYRWLQLGPNASVKSWVERLALEGEVTR